MTTKKYIFSITNIINRLFYICFIAITLLASACIKNEETRGYMSDDKRIAKVKSGDSKDEVLKILGSPSSKSTFGDEKWYYISMKLEQRAFLNADVVNQDTYVISFNKSGNVTKVDKQSGRNGKELEIAKDETPTEGNKIGLFQQLLGNLGKFNPKGDE